jgi:DNA polymerase-3 subunit epsilon
MFSLFSRKRAKTIHPVFARNNSYFAELDQDQPLSSYEFVVFDTELTGMNNRRDEIVSIGAVRIKNLQIIAGENFQSFVRPHKITTATEGTFIHRITPQQLTKAPSLKEILPEFIEFCGSSLLIGHYVSLDVSFINKAAKKLFNAKIKNPCLDTMRLAQVYTETSWEQYHDRFNLQVSYNLTDLSRTYNLPVFSEHDAMLDALQTAYLFLFLAKKLKLHNLITLRDLFRAGQSWKNIF